MLTTTDTTPTPATSVPPPPTPPSTPDDELRLEDVQHAVQDARDHLFKDGKLDPAAMFALRALEAQAERLDPGAAFDVDAVLRVPSLYPATPPSSTDAVTSSHHARITRLQAMLDVTLDTFAPVNEEARRAAIAQEIPNVRRGLKPTEKVSELDVQQRAARIVDQREAERRRALAQDATETLRQELASLDQEWHRTFQQRRAVPVPQAALLPEEQAALTDDRGLLGGVERLTASALIENRRTQGLLGELLAVSLVPESTPPAELLDILADETASPYARARADALFAKQAARLKAERLLHTGNVALLDRYLELREQRVPEPVRRAEAAEYRFLTQLEAEATRVGSVLHTWTLHKVVGSFDPGRVATDRAARAQALRELNVHWRPIAQAARKARG